MKQRLFLSAIPAMAVLFLAFILTDRREETQICSETFVNADTSLDMFAIAEEILNAYVNPSEGVRDLVGTGRYYSVKIDSGMSLISCLEKSENTWAPYVATELLFHYASGDGQWRRKTDVFKGLIPTDIICSKAAQYLGNSDPYVSAMAEWAISTRVNWEMNEALENPDRFNKREWFAKWLEYRKNSSLVENDYIRQAWAQGIYRSSEKLLENAAFMRDRNEALIAWYLPRLDKSGEDRLLGAWKGFSDTFSSWVNSENKEDLFYSREKWLELRKAVRKIIECNPDLDMEEILFATRHANHSGENITNGAKSYINKPGGDICIKSGIDPAEPAKGLIQGKLGPGHIKGLDLSWDAGSVVFSFARQPDYYNDTIYESDQGFDDYAHGLSGPAHLYELRIKGKKISQITDHPYNSDIEPTYLPDGDIAFSSSRSDFGSQCSGHFFQNKKIVNLYKVHPDGEGLISISNNKDFDRYARTMDNGLLIFTRWEYQERHLWQTHNLWTSRPDGTMSEAIFKQHVNNGPMSLRDARSIPGSEKLVAIGCGHHEWAQGAVFLLDYQKGINENDGFECLTPHITDREGGLGDKDVVPEGGVVDSFGVYQQPFALSEKSFLVSYSWFIPRKVFNATNFGIYYIDVWGNKELIHLEPVLSSIYPMTFEARKRPAIIPDMHSKDKNYASTYITDIYEGLPEIERGKIKYLRISQHTEWPTIQTGETVIDYNHLHYTPSGSWSRSLGLWTWSPARSFGIVPVEEDGSAYFKTPVGIPVYFQALDENYLELRRMRTFVSLQPGEMRGCTGCHESRDESPVSLSYLPEAITREPSVPSPPSWGDTQLPDFEMHIQPVFDRHCIRCHNPGDLKGGLDFTGRKVDAYNQSYRSLFGLSADEPTPVQEVWSRKLMVPEHENPVEGRSKLEKMERNQYPGQLIFISNRYSDNSVTEPYAFGSYVSPLIQVLLNDYHQSVVDIGEDDWITLVTWIDLNAPYWGSFVDKEPVRADEKPRRIFVEYPPAFSDEPYAFKIQKVESLFENLRSEKE